MAQTELTDPTLQTRHLKPVLQLACLSPAATLPHPPPLTAWSQFQIVLGVTCFLSLDLLTCCAVTLL